MEEKKKSRILIVGVTGNLGFQLAKASLRHSHPTFGLVRDFTNPTNSHKLHSLSDAGATLLKARFLLLSFIISKKLPPVIC